MTSRRRGHGEGTISRRKDGRWVAVVDLGWRDGKRARKFLYGRTRREVAEKLARALRAQQEGLVVANERTTVEQYLTLWLTAVRPSLRPRTWQRYEQLIRLHVIPQAGKLRLGRLAPEHLQQLYTARIQAGLSPTTVLQLHRILHRALGQAARWSLVARNVTELVTPPQKASHDFAVLSPKQARRFVQAVRGDRLEALYVLAITTGMRQGELLGLRWADVDLEQGALHLVKRLKAAPRGGRCSCSRPPWRPSYATVTPRSRSAAGSGMPGTTTVWSSRIRSADPSTPATCCGAPSTRC
jgi:integrase